MEICVKEKCTGCSACATVCPNACITMAEDEIGHFIPVIDEEKCTNCGACQKMCPNNKQIERNKPHKAYAAVSADNKDYQTSSSGGAASVFSKYIVENGGAVYGCTGTKGYDICHIRVDNIDELAKLKGSKYVESRMGNTFELIKNDLQDDKTVLFIGTPCQCAGAKSLFSKYDNFYAVDLICHGVPPQKLLKEHLSEKLNKEPDEIRFREGADFCFKAIKNGKVINQYSNLFDLYYIGFFKSLYYRNSCYNCSYANSERCSDITIGDFWGLGKSEIAQKHKNGVSVVLVNTKKGEQLFENCQNEFLYEQRDVDEAVNGNAQLRRPSFKHKNTEKFRRIYPKLGFKKAAGRCLIINRIKYLILAAYNKVRN